MRGGGEIQLAIKLQLPTFVPFATFDFAGGSGRYGDLLVVTMVPRLNASSASHPHSPITTNNVAVL